MCRLSKYPLSATYLDHRTTAVTMRPYDPQKVLTISNTKEYRLKIKQYFR